MGRNDWGGTEFLGWTFTAAAEEVAEKNISKTKHIPRGLKPRLSWGCDAGLKARSTVSGCVRAFPGCKGSTLFEALRRPKEYAMRGCEVLVGESPAPWTGSGQALSQKKTRDKAGAPWGVGFLFGQGGEVGATLAEFAFTLPFLAVILYVIFDFGGAFTLKQKLEAVVYEATRAAASQSTSDLSNPAVDSTGSVADLRDTVARNLQAAGVNDCGLLGAASTSASATTSTWVYTVSGGGCPAPLTLTIQRQSTTTVGGVWIFFSHVTLQYPFQFRLAGVLQVFSPGSSFPSSTNIVVNAKMKNLV